MTAAEVENYRQNIVQNFGDSVVITVRTGGCALNAGDTGNRDAHGGISWINYWRAITKNNDTILHCSSCGKVIFVGELTQAQIRQNLPIGANIEDYRAHGGHIKLLPPVDAKWREGYTLLLSVRNVMLNMVRESPLEQEVNCVKKLAQI